MQGIEQLTNIMTEGGRSDVPMSMGAQPMGAPQGIAGMMPPQDMAMMQQEQVPNPADSAPQGIDINSDADMLASAVVGRTNGDLDEAEQVLEQSLMLIKTAKSRTQQPTMAAYGKPIMAAEGKPIPDGKEGAGLRALPDEVVEKMGFVKAADGKPIQSPTGFEKVMQSLGIQVPMSQTGVRSMSDADYRTMLRTLITDSLANQRGRVMSDRDMNTARSLSDKDLETFLTQSGRRISDADRKTMRPSNKLAYGGDVKKMMGGGQMMKYADGGEMEEYNMGGQIIPFI